MIRFEDENGRSMYMYDAADVAKYINIKDDKNKPIGRNKLIELLRFNGYVMKDSNQPSQYLVTLGIAQFYMVKRRYKRYGMLLFHERALEYFKNRIADGRLQIGFQKRVVKEYDCVKKLEDIC